MLLLYLTGSLVLKIPWKNLYNSTVKVEVGGLYLVAVPNIGMRCSSSSTLFRQYVCLCC